MYIVMLGAQGTGKGTIAKILAKKTGLPHISTGEMFREQINKQTELGKIADSYISKGNLVPNEITNEVVENRLACEDAKNGVILDGYPRNIEQVKALDNMLAKKSHKVTIVVELVIPDNIIIDRINNRVTCSNNECGTIYNKKFKPPKIEGICDICGSKLEIREDDSTKEAIQKRLDIYKTNSKEIINYYKQKEILVEVKPNDPTAENASEQVVNTIMSLIK